VFNDVFTHGLALFFALWHDWSARHKQSKEDIRLLKGLDSYIGLNDVKRAV
jgi:hypothetical protein